VAPDAVERLPLFPLNSVLVPGMPLRLHVFEQRYRKMVNDLLEGGLAGAPEFGVVALRHGWEVGGVGDLYEIGTAARIIDVLPHTDGRCDLSAIGTRRFRIRTLDVTSEPYLMGSVSQFPDQPSEVSVDLVGVVRRRMAEHLTMLSQLGASPMDPADLPTDPVELSYIVAQHPGLPMSDRQGVLAGQTCQDRLGVAKTVLRRECELLRLLHAVPAGASTFRAAQSPG
jgi:Lon protease-like protein